MRQVVGLFILVTSSLVGCSLPSNGSLDYRQARTLPPLQMPDQLTDVRPSTPIYPTPAVQQSTLKMANSSQTRFVMPKPQPLDLSQTAASTQVSIGKPSAPTIVTDGNGYPILRIEGDAGQIWQMLNQAIDAANLTVVYRNQTLARIDLKQQDRAILLRLDRMGTTTTVTAQNDKDALVDQALAQDLFAQIMQHWPS